jgi:hypothetical protein
MYARHVFVAVSVIGGSHSADRRSVLGHAYIGWCVERSMSHGEA